jgi:hypothetical protein
VARTDDDVPHATADPQFVAIDQPLIAHRQLRHREAVVASRLPHLPHLAHVVARHAGALVEHLALPAAMVAAGTRRMKRARLVVLRARHQQWALEVVGDHAGLPDVVGMHVRTDDALDRPATHVAGEQLMPQRVRFLIAKAGVDDIPAVVVVEQVQIDVGE